MRTKIGGLRPPPTELIASHEYSPAWARVSTLNVNVFEAINVPSATSCSNRLSCNVRIPSVGVSRYREEKLDPYLVIPNDTGRGRVAVHVAHEFQIVSFPERVQTVAGCEVDGHDWAV